MSCPDPAVIGLQSLLVSGLRRGRRSDERYREEVRRWEDERRREEERQHEDQRWQDRLRGDRRREEKQRWLEREELQGRREEDFSYFRDDVAYFWEEEV